MANRSRGYGYSREVANRINSKYSEDDEQEVVAWISSIIEDSPEEVGKEHFYNWLKDGLVLNSLMNTLVENSCKPHNLCGVKLAAMRKNKEMENISFFLQAAEKYGVDKGDLFQTVDLYEAQNLGQVQATLYKLSGVAEKNGYGGPSIGVKIAEKNKREFDEQQLREGRNVIGLQMGTNQVASQKGMTPCGLGRQLTPQTK